MEKDWKLVYSTSQQLRAQTIVSALKAANIEPVLLNKQDSSYLFGEVEIYVHLAQINEALIVIKQFENE